MFKWLRRLIFLSIIIIVIGLILILMFPNHYEKESTIEINAPVEKVFAHAEKLDQWNMFAMLSGYTGSMKDIKGAGTIPADQLDQYAGKIKDQIGSLDMKVIMVKTDFPKLLSYKIEGGPMSGIQPEMVFTKLDDQKTRVTHKESFIFTGFFGSIKAFAAKYGTGKLTENGLTNLKKISEQPKKD
jgi:hypothetical protein